MKIIDISWPISTATTGYKDRTVVAFEPLKNFDADGVRDSNVHLNSHAGTHVDAPAHFMRDGVTIDHVPLSRLIGPCTVLDLTNVPQEITYDVLVAKEKKMSIAAGDIILLKTSNSDLPPTNKFNPHFVYVHASASEYLVHKKIKTVGIDYLGIERSQPEHPTHLAFMKHNIAIIEGLRLAHVQEGNYFLCCLPLAIVGLEAAPARAVLLEKI